MTALMVVHSHGMLVGDGDGITESSQAQAARGVRFYDDLQNVYHPR